MTQSYSLMDDPKIAKAVESLNKYLAKELKKGTK